MHSRPSHSRLSGSAFHSRISALLLTMVSTMAAIYVAGRLWQDAADRVYLIQEIDRRNGQSSLDLDTTGLYYDSDVLGATLTTYLDKPHVYIGCMKSGEVFSEPTRKWYEPDWWKFGDAKSYFRHASGELYAISRALAQFISINRSILRAYAHDDVSAGSWFIGLDVKHIDERKFCCSSWMPGAICTAV
ncbi:hypothetical protein FF1_014816 [Malus domestica]